MGKIRGSLGAVAAATLLSGCTDAAGYDLDYILARAPFVATMRTTVAYESQTMPRLPAPGSVPVSSPMGDAGPQFMQAQLDSAAATLSNPLPPNEATLARGAVVYANQCFVCHGAEGAGNGPVVGAGRFPLGPAVNAGPAATQSDGYLYAIIRAGRGLMPAYGDRITHNDRWALVHYIRQLQGQTVGAPAVAADPAAAGDPAGAVETPATPQPEVLPVPGPEPVETEPAAGTDDPAAPGVQ